MNKALHLSPPVLALVLGACASSPLPEEEREIIVRECTDSIRERSGDAYYYATLETAGQGAAGPARISEPDVTADSEGNLWSVGSVQFDFPAADERDRQARYICTYRHHSGSHLKYLHTSFPVLVIPDRQQGSGKR